MKLRISFLSVLLTLSTLQSPLSTVLAQGTAFTYQGRLNDGAIPANGSYDLQFAIYDSTNNPGTLIAGPLTNSAVGVSNGFFTVTLDFGPGALTGRAVWLELGVRTNGVGLFAILSPRQQLTPVPYAIIAESLAGSGTNNILQAGSTASIIVGGQNNLIRNNSVDAIITGGEQNSIGANASDATIGGGFQNGIRDNSGSSTIGGGNSNVVLSNATYSTIAGGYRNVIQSSVAYAAIGGGWLNQIGSYGFGASTAGGVINTNGGDTSFIGGGYGNWIQDAADRSVIGGGQANTIVGDAIFSVCSTISGGLNNTIVTNGLFGSIGGGATNSAGGAYATVPGGTQNAALGTASFAAGNRAKALHNGAFVWGDSAAADFSSTASNQFLIRASGGVGIGTPNPQGSLHVYSDNNPTVARIQSTGTPGFGRLEFVSNPQGDPNEWRPAYIQSLDTGGFTGGLGFYVNGTGIGNKFASNEVMRIINGTVGINKPNPATALDVNGTVTATSFSGNGSGLTGVNAGSFQGFDSTNFWKVAGNSGTTPGGNFIGTADNQALELKVNGARALRLEPNATSPNVIGGYSGNVVSNGFSGATIAGGGSLGFENRVGATAGFVGGGLGNVVSANYSTIGGGLGNACNAGAYATVPGGQNNVASGQYSLAAGRNAVAQHDGAFVWADSSGSSFVSTGTNQFLIRASGGVGIGTPSPATALHVRAPSDVEFSLESTDVGGRRYTLQSSDNHSGILSSSFQIIDRTLGVARFVIITNGNVGIGNTSPTNALMVVNARCDGNSWINASDRNLKENFKPVDARDLLARVAELPILEWNYKNDNASAHLGPTAQDFHAAFHLGAGDTGIATVDESGVALAAIQGLNQKLSEELKQKETEITELKQRLESLERTIREHRKD